MKARIEGGLLALVLAAPACERDRPPPAPPPAVVPAHDAAMHPAVAAHDAGPTERVVLRVRVKNIDTVPLRILTNPDSNEMIWAYRLRVSPEASDRAAMFADGDRVKAFPIGQMALCTADGGAGYGGLGQPGDVTLAPGESFEAAHWDGILREEVLDPQRGVCAREIAPTPGRYRFQLDQPQLEGRPQCQRAIAAWPIAADAGAPVVLELRSRNAPRDAGPRS